MKFFLLLLCFFYPNSSFTKEKTQKESFLDSYKIFQDLKKKDKAIAEITSDISLFLEAKKASFEENAGQKPWEEVFSIKKNHLKDEFIESWADILLQKNIEKPSILEEAENHRIDAFVEELFLHKETIPPKKTKALINFIKDQGLTEHIPTKPETILEKEYLEKKASSSLLYKLLLALFYDLNTEKEKSIHLLRNATEELEKNSSFRYLNFYFYNVLARNLRHTSHRKEAAYVYQKLIKLWESEGEKIFPVVMQGPDRTLEKINDYLWSSRYQSLIGEKKLATTHVNRAFKEIKALEKKRLDWKQNKTLKEYFFEAYYVKIFRISFYFGDYQTGTEEARKVLEEKNVPSHWKDHFYWHYGLGLYLQGKKKEASKAWENFLSKRRYARNKDKIYFWLSKVYKERKLEKQSLKYQKKLENYYPFSFYTVFSSNLGDFSSQKSSFKKEQTETQKKRKINKRNKLLVSLIRAEILIASGFLELARGELENTYYLTRPRKFTLGNLDFYLYLSELFHEAEMYPRSIALTELLSGQYRNFWKKAPQAVSLYYPLAFPGDFKKVSEAYSLKQSLLLSISRKESLFNPKAKSHANALGLMQLIPKTAKLRAQEIGLKDFEPETDLFDKETNLSLSGAYLKNLHNLYKGDSKKIIAAYNAGEFCVDEWTKEIRVKEDLTWIELIPFGETRRYVKAVLSNEKIYEKLLGQEKTRASKLMSYTRKYFSL